MTSYNNKATKVTTNANGIATYQIPAKATSFKLLAGFWYSGTRVSEYIEHEGTTLLTYTTQKSITLSNVPATIKVSQTSYYYKNANLKVVVKNSVTKKAVANKKVKLKFSNGKTVGVTTNSKGVAKYTMKYDPKNTL